MKKNLVYLLGPLTVVSLISSLFSVPAKAGMTYTDNITADPLTFSCGFYAATEICGGYSILNNEPRYASPGDQYNENISFTTPVSVPGSNTSDVIYVRIIDFASVFGPGGPPPVGPFQATINSTLLGYSGPPNPIASPYSYVSSTGGGYFGIAGFCCGYGVPNNGFSVTGIDRTFDIITGDPSPIVVTTFGYAVDLPATPAILSDIQGGTPGHPAILPAGEIGQLSVNLTGEGDQDYYGFYWNGGLFQANGNVADAEPNGFYEYQLLAADGTVIDSATLDGANGFGDQLSDMLSPGYYVVGVTADSPNDPLFTLAFDTPVASTAGIPEPATWAMMLVGFGGIGAAMRSRRKADVAAIA